MPTYRSLECGAALLVATFALGACGSGASRHHAQSSGSLAQSPGPLATQPGDPTGEPNAIIARIAGHAITRAMFEHSLTVLVRSESPNAVVPEPPDFAACVRHLQAAPAPTESGGPNPTASALKGECQQHYQTLKTQALDSLIVDQWVTGAAAEVGARVSDAELQQELRKVEAGQSEAQAAQELAKSGRTLADFVHETKVQLLAEGIRHLLARRTSHLTDAQVVDFYNAHRSIFSVPRRRDLQIVRAESQAEAQTIKREIAAGRTFASVAKSLPPANQPIHSKEGLVLGYEPGFYREPPLDHAIFAAKPRVLTGPVGISLGYYVFEVKRTYPPHKKTPAQAQAEIRMLLPHELYNQALVAFIRQWRAKWRARTNCRAEYVVPKCKQYKVTAASPPEKEDSYTFN
jgi:parvulin-like peptidyl-prolyl isomerase